MEAEISKEEQNAPKIDIVVFAVMFVLAETLAILWYIYAQSFDYFKSVLSALMVLGLIFNVSLVGLLFNWNWSFMTPCIAGLLFISAALWVLDLANSLTIHFRGDPETDRIKSKLVFYGYYIIIAYHLLLLTFILSFGVACLIALFAVYMAGRLPPKAKS